MASISHMGGLVRNRPVGRYKPTCSVVLSYTEAAQHFIQLSFC